MSRRHLVMLVELARAHDPQVLADVGDLVDTAVRLSYEPERARAAALLVKTAGRRQRLEELHDVYLDRLYQRSSDFDATRGLTLTVRALQELPPAS